TGRAVGPRDHVAHEQPGRHAPRGRPRLLRARPALPTPLEGALQPRVRLRARMPDEFRVDHPPVDLEPKELLPARADEVRPRPVQGEADGRVVTRHHTLEPSTGARLHSPVHVVAHAAGRLPGGDLRDLPGALPELALHGPVTEPE